VRVSGGVERQRQREADLLAVLNWFRRDKAALAPHIHPEDLDRKEKMKERAQLRQSIRERTQDFGGKPWLCCWSFLWEIFLLFK